MSAFRDSWRSLPGATASGMAALTVAPGCCSAAFPAAVEGLLELFHQALQILVASGWVCMAMMGLNSGVMPPHSLRMLALCAKTEQILHIVPAGCLRR